MSSNVRESTRKDADRSPRVEERSLPDRIDIPHIKGEMVHLRPASISDLTRMDELEAFYNSTGITGKGPQAERAVVNTWVKRSVAWSKGLASRDSGVGDPESRRTIAWAMVTDADQDPEGKGDSDFTNGMIGMIFLIDVDGWSRSARIQVVLGKDYRSRGYSRDAMPRVMTYGYAARPEGLSLHRIWVAVPEKNTRSISVYQSLGFVPSGTSRDALWDEEGGKYQDQIVMDALVDEYDPIRSLNAFGMHIIEGNPGVSSALASHGYAQDGTPLGTVKEPGMEGATAGPAGPGPLPAPGRETVAPAPRSGGSQPSTPSQEEAAGGAGGPGDGDPTGYAPSDRPLRPVRPDGGDDCRKGEEAPAHGELGDQAGPGRPEDGMTRGEHDDGGTGHKGPTGWPYASSSEHPASKRAWWRNVGHGRKRSIGGDR